MKRSTLLAKGLPLAALVLVGVGALAWWRSSVRAGDESTEEPVEAIKHQGARLLVPERSPLRRTIVMQEVREQAVATQVVLPAVVDADPAKLVRILPPITGRIINLKKHLGDQVKAGEELFDIEASDLANALSDASKADAARVLAQKTLDRQRSLESASISAERELEQAESDYEQAVSEAKRAALVLTQMGVVDRRSIKGNHLEVRSPVSGTIIELTAGEGGYWNDATLSTMTIADLSTVFVTGSAQEKDLRHLYVGEDATVTLDAYPEQPLHGKVQYVSETLNPETRTAPVRIVFDNTNGQLKPGMFAQATYQDRPHKGLVIPVSAVVQSGFYSRAFVEVAPWCFESRVVRLGPQFGNQIEVLSGIKPGERVVIKQGVVLNSG